MFGRGVINRFWVMFLGFLGVNLSGWLIGFLILCIFV